MIKLEKKKKIVCCSISVLTVSVQLEESMVCHLLLIEYPWLLRIKKTQYMGVKKKKERKNRKKERKCFIGSLRLQKKYF